VGIENAEFDADIDSIEKNCKEFMRKLKNGFLDLFG
jgi:hypothetical protein